MLVDKHKFDVNLADKRGWKALHFSAKSGNCELVTYFADMGTGIHPKTNDGVNCLHIAAQQGNLNLCKVLIDKHKFDLDMADNYGWASLHRSSKNGSYKLLAYFAEMGADIHLETNDGKNCLHIAALEGHLNLCKALIEIYMFNVNLANIRGWTLLHVSAQIGNYELVTYFADMGTDIHLKTNAGLNCLHIAALKGHFNLCKVLVDKHKFDVNLADKRGWTALHFSALSGNYELVTYFADMGTGIHPKTNDGINCLHIAAQQGNLNLCKVLIDKHKFDLDMADDYGWTSFHRSSKNGSYELFAYLAEMGADIHLETNDGKNCLHIAALEGHLNLCNVLIKKHKFEVNLEDKSGLTALHLSAENGNYELVTSFADMGTDIHLKTNAGLNCLHIAAQQGNLNLCKVLIDKHKFDLDMADNYGWTVLHSSSGSGSYELFTYFAVMGTDVHLKTDDGENCLHIAALEGHFNLCKVLVDKHKFDVNLADKCGLTALHLSAQIGNYELVTYFADMGTGIHLKTNDGVNCLHIAAEQGHLNLCKVLIEKHKFDSNMADNYGWTALHRSSKIGSYELLTYFADRVTDIHRKANDGENCLHIAALEGHFNLCKVLVDKHKFDVNLADKCGLTALHLSAQIGNYELVTYFADMGTGIHLKTNDGVNCLHIAAEQGHLNLCKVLIEKHKFDLNMADNYGWTALHRSSKNGSYELLTYFADRVTDIHCKTNDGENCLHIAAFEGHFKLCKYFLEIHNFDVKLKDNGGRTSLHNCARNGSFDLFLYILEKGSEIYCKTNNMENVLHFSAKNGHVHICEFLLERFTKDYEKNSTRNQHTLIGESYMSQVFYKYNTIFLHAMDNDGNTYLHLAAA